VRSERLAMMLLFCTEPPPPRLWANGETARTEITSAVVNRLSHPPQHSLQADTTENPPNVSIATH
jgi:hypothetical protein